MTQRPQYAIVPREPTTEMVQAGQCYVGLFQKFPKMVEAAPPPPEQVLDDQKIHSIIQGAGPDNELGIARAIERAVLQNLGAKNG